MEPATLFEAVHNPLFLPMFAFSCLCCSSKLPYEAAAVSLFVFVKGELPVPDAIPFDMYGVEWGHHGDHCTFETILALHDLKDPILQQIGHIIHGADITADADETLESPGIDLLFRGLRLISQSDTEALIHGHLVMDALYAALKAEG